MLRVRLNKACEAQARRLYCIYKPIKIGILVDNIELYRPVTISKTEGCDFNFVVRNYNRS